MAIFITGTDTGCGKTHAAAALVKQYQAYYWKPVQTGFPPDSDAETIKDLLGFHETENDLLAKVIPATCTFKEPLSPHRAAELENRSINVSDLIVAYENLSCRNEPLVIEGAGGVMVPVDRRHTWLDFLLETGMSVVVAARTGLGTINHTLLTIEALRSRNIAVAGLLFCGPDNPDNIRTITDFSAMPVIGRFDLADGIPADIDRQRMLQPLLG